MSGRGQRVIPATLRPIRNGVAAVTSAAASSPSPPNKKKNSSSTAAAKKTKTPTAAAPAAAKKQPPPTKRTSANGRMIVASTLPEARSIKEADATGSPAMMLIHAPWCHFCESLRPAWDDAAKKAMGRGMNVVEIEMGVMGALDGRLKSRIEGANHGQPLSSVPGIFFVGHKGDITQYDRPRSSESLLSFAEDRHLLRPGRPLHVGGAARGRTQGRGKDARKGQALPSSSSVRQNRK